MVKFKMFYDSDKETKWLNRMAEQGWAMTGIFFGFYRFAKCEPGEYIYQVDITEKLFSLSEDYQQFMEEMGVEIVCLWGPWVVLRRRAEEGSFKMYTDVESTIAHYTRVRKWFSVAGALECVCLIEGIYIAVLQKPVQIMGWGIVFAAAVILLLFMKEIVRLNGILKELNGRLGRKTSESGGMFSAFASGIHAGGVSIGLLCAVILSPMMYALLHELGHCIVVWIYGGTVTGFHPFSPTPYMTYEGNFVDRLALVDIGGSVLPLVAAAAILLFYKGSKKHSWLNICLGITSSISILTVIPWIVEPVCCLFGLADETGDIIKFINNTGFHPVAVALCSIIVLALMCILFVRKIPRLFGLEPGQTGEAAGRKFIISMASLAIAMGIVIQVLGLLSSAGEDEVLAEGNFRYTDESSRDSMLQEEFDIEIQKPGEYVIHTEWETDSEGVIAAVVLRDEDEVYFYCTGSIYLRVESGLMYLDNSCNLSFYILRCEEDWLEFCRITGADVNDLSDVSWEPDAPPAATGSYRLIQKR